MPQTPARHLRDLTELRSAPFTRSSTTVPKGQADAEYSQFLRDTGFDYERDLDRVAVSIIKAGKDSKLFAVAEGRFDRSKVEPYAAAQALAKTAVARIFSCLGRSRSQDFFCVLE